jgi:hypothetical protein
MAKKKEPEQAPKVEEADEVFISPPEKTLGVNQDE